MRSGIRIAVAVALALSAACGRDAERAPDAANAVGGTASVASAASGASAADGAKVGCPATGAWAPCSVIERLERAGLAPKRDTAAVRVKPLTVSGMRVTVGKAELDVFIYPDAAARQRDERQLDRKEFVELGESPSLRREPTLIRNTNLLALLHSLNDHQRERVADVLTAGPPQPVPPNAGSGARR